MQFGATDGAVYTGLAVAGSLLYAADTRNGKIDVFNNSFQKTTVSGAFTDPNVPAGFTPYNIRTSGASSTSNTRTEVSRVASSASSISTATSCSTSATRT